MTPTTLTMDGEVTLAPTLGGANGVPTVVATLGCSMNLQARAMSDLTLDSNGEVTIDFAGCESADFVIITVSEGPPIEVWITSELGDDQKVPVATQLMIVTPQAPITGLKVKRTPGQESTLSYVLGQLA